MKKEKYEFDDSKDSSVVKIMGQIRGFLVTLLVVIVVVFLVNTFVGRIVKVEGHSMDPTLNHGQTLILDSLTYKFSDPKRFDIVVFPHNNKFFIKRIIGLPNETVQIIDGKFYINGEKLEGDNFSSEPISKPMYGQAANKVVLGHDEYFCVGDNRNHSGDSRTKEVGNIHRYEFTGRAIYRIFPFKERGSLIAN